MNYNSTGKYIPGHMTAKISVFGIRENRGIWDKIVGAEIHVTSNQYFVPCITNER